MAYIENPGEASQKTKVLPDPWNSTLIRGVVGEDEAFPGQMIEYRVTNSNKDGEAGKVNDGSDVKWAIKIGENRKNLEDENGTQITGEKITLRIEEKWASKEITVMPFLKNPTETVSVKTRVSQFKWLHSAINNSIYGVLNKDQRDSLIAETINIMEEHNLDTFWVKDTQNILKTESQNKIFLKVLVVRQDGMPGGSPAAAAFVEGTLISGSEFLIYLNATVIAEKKRSTENLQAYFVHELRHFWQSKNNAEWAGKLTRTAIKMDRGTEVEKTYKDIRIEVDAHSVQFEFERKLDIGVDEEDMRNFFGYVEKNFSPSEAEKKKAGYLRINGYEKDKGYIDPFYTH